MNKFIKPKTGSENPVTKTTRRMNGKTILVVLVVFMLLATGVMNATRYITNTYDSWIFSGKWNSTTSKLNNSQGFWHNWNTTTNKANNTEDFGHVWNDTSSKLNNSQGFWHNWNQSMQKINNSQNFWVMWNSSGTNGSFAPNVTFVTNSKGNKFPATATGVRQALWDFNNTNGGIIYVPVGTYSFYDNLTLDNNVTIIGSGSTDIRFDYNKGTVFNLFMRASVVIIHGKIWNLNINASTGWHGDYALYVDGKSYIWQSNKIIDNIGVRESSGGYNHTGVGFIAIGATRQECIAKSSFGTFSVYGFMLGVEIHSDDSALGAYVNGNSFERIDIHQCIYGMNITGINGGESSYNEFISYDQEPIATTRGGLYINNGANGNNFLHCMFWDWVGYGMTLNVSGTRNIFSGWFAKISGGINDSGIGNVVNLLPYESRTYVVYPIGRHDGTHIDSIAENIQGDSGEVVLMPGYYDLESTIYSAKKVYYKFMEGAVFNVSSSFTPGVYVWQLAPYSTMSGHGIIDIKNVTGVRGVSTSNYCKVNDIEIRNGNTLTFVPYGCYNVIDNCKIINTYGTAMDVGALELAHNTTISNCLIRNVTGSNSYGMRVRSSNVIVQGCRVENVITPTSDASGIFVTTSGGIPWSKNILITNNYVYNSKIGIYVTNSRNTTIVENEVDTMSTVGLWTVGNDTVMTNNKLYRCTSGITMSSALRPLTRDNIGHMTFFDIINRTNPQAGYAWFNSATNRLMVKRSGGNWAIFYANQSGTTGNFAPNVTYITNSLGHKFSSSGTNLQTAINELSNASGWVDGGNNNISLSTSLKVGDNLELRNVRLYLADSVNKSVIVNYAYGTSSRNHDIYIHEIYINGNSLHQPEWHNVNQEMEQLPNGIYLERCSNVTIENIKEYNIAGGGVFVERGQNILVTDSKFFEMGKVYDDSGSALDNWYACGIWAYNCTEVVISDCIINDSYVCGIVIESHYNTPEDHWNKRNIVSNCIVTDTAYGIYFEDAGDTLVTNCITKNCTATEVWTAPAGIYLNPASKNVTISNCLSYNDYESIDDSGENTLITGCSSFSSEVSTLGAYVLYGRNTTVSSCTIVSPVGCGLYSQAENMSFIGNRIENAGNLGISYTSSASFKRNNSGGMIKDNIIIKTVSHGISVVMCNTTIEGNEIYFAGNYGISASANYSNIKNNRIIRSTNGGIAVYWNRGTLSGNVINGGCSWGYGILLSGARFWNVIGNSIYQSGSNAPDYGIYESGTANYNNIRSNYLNLTTASGVITVAGSSTQVFDNYGYYTFFDLVNKTTSQSGFAWFDSANNILRIKRSGGNWAKIYTNTTSGTGGGNNLTAITNSLGLNYPVTNTGLQSAIYALNSTNGGWVRLPVCNISITITVWLVNNTKLFGAGPMSILYLADDANVTILQNRRSSTWHTTNDAPFKWNHDIEICDLTLDGNCFQQTNAGGLPYWTASTHANFKHTVKLVGVNNSYVHDVRFKRSLSSGIWVSSGMRHVAKNFTAENCDFNGTGAVYEGTGMTHWWANGITVSNVSKTIIENCRFSYVYANGIVIEQIYTPTTYDYERFTNQTTITNCYLYDCENGIYFETTRYSTIDNCFVQNCGIRYDVYGEGYGIRFDSPTSRCIISNTIVRDCGSPTEAGGNYWICGGNNTLVGCTSIKSTRSGFNISGTAGSYGNHTLIGCSSYNDRDGIYNAGYQMSVQGCTMANSTRYGYNSAAVSTLNKIGSVSNCKILRAGITGIYLNTWNNTVTGNMLYFCPTGIEVKGNFNTICNNIISGSSTNGIYFNGVNHARAQRNIAMGNVIKSDATYGIRMGTYSSNNTVMGNVVAGAGTGIYEGSSTSLNNSFIGNNVKLCTTPMSISGGEVVRDNIGYKTEEWGNCSIPTGSTSITVYHNLSTTPDSVVITVQGNSTCGNGQSVPQVYFTSSTIRITLPGKVVATCHFNWYAKV